MKFSTRISRSPSHLIKFWASEYPRTVGSSGHPQKSASWCFVFWSLLSAPNSVFDDFVLFGKLMKFSTRISRSPYHLIKFWASEYSRTVGSSGHPQKLASSCFDHNFLLQLRFWWSWTLWKAYEIVYKNIQKSISLDQVLGTDSMHQFNRCYYFMWNSTNSAFI